MRKIANLIFAAGLVAIAAGCSPTESMTAQAPSASGKAGGTLFVANKRGNTLSKIDLATGQEVLRLDSCTNPH